MYRVECDKCGDGDDGEYYAWIDHQQALEHWADGDDLVFGERAYHVGCLPPELCRYGDEPYFHHTPGEDDPGTCAECDQEIPQ
jgi:hypothetical protein